MMNGNRKQRRASDTRLVTDAENRVLCAACKVHKKGDASVAVQTIVDQMNDSDEQTLMEIRNAEVV